MQNVVSRLETAVQRLHRQRKNQTAFRVAFPRIGSFHSSSRTFQHVTTLPINHGILSLVEKFQLQPLSNSTCTRILTIKPSSDRSAPVHLEIEEIDLAGQYEPFVAVSHVWGSNLRYDRVILCNGKPCRVTGRVDSILHRIRAKMLENEQCRHWKRVWIDTLCIDQAENMLALEEKSHQVSIMHQIFGNAKEVIIDLGRADRYSHLLPIAISDIELLRQKAFDDEYCKFILGFPSAVKVDEVESRRVRRSLEACSRLLDKQWFSRIWAIQEFALAPSATFLLGNIRVDGRLLQLLAALASDANVKGRSHLAMLFSRFRRALALTKLPRLASIRQNGNIDASKKLKLGESLGLGWHHDSSDERDVVYALRALVDYRDSPLKVDYNEPANMLARRVSQKLIELGDYEGMLAGARGGFGDANSNDPTWAFRLRIPFKFVGEERQWILSGKPTKYCAGGPLTKSPTLSRSLAHGNSIEALAAIVGEIQIVTERFPNIPQYGSNPKLPVERLFTYNTERAIHTRAIITEAWLRHILPAINQRTGHQLLSRHSDELWRAITHGHNAMEFRSNPIKTQERVDHWLMLIDMALQGLQVLGYRSRGNLAFSEELRKLEAVMKRRHTLLHEATQKPQTWLDEVHKDLLTNLNQSTVLAGQYPTKDQDFCSQRLVATTDAHETILKQVLMNTYLVNETFDIRKVRPPDQLKMIGRRVCVLHDGRLATVPYMADIGDVVAIFKGISVPYILRRDQENYKLVGMAYVDDIMHGEAVNGMTQWKKITVV